MGDVDIARVFKARREVLKAGSAEQGFTIIETVIAIGLFALLIAGVATSTSLGLRIVGGSSARQSATQVASQEIESLRAEGYARLGHVTAPSPLGSPNPDNPDNDIVPSASCTPTTQPCYRVPDIGLETFVSGTGVTVHGPDTVTRQGQTFTVYRYVTVVAAAPTLRRLTVVAQGTGKAPAGGPNRVVLSTVFSTGVIAF